MTQIQLSDAQTAILGAACARPDGCVFPIAALKGGAVRLVCKSLLSRGLVEEAPASDPAAAWREDEAGAVTLRATALAYEVLGVARPDEAAADAGSEAAEAAKTEEPKTGRRKDSKQAMVVAMLKRPEGADLQQIVEATGWLPHTARGAIAGALKKRLGLSVTAKVEEGRRVYRIEN